MAKVKPRVKVPNTAEAGEIIEIKTLISHPMHSGRAVDGDGNLIPRKIIKSFHVSFNGTEVMSVNLKPSVSANPFFTFPFKVTESGTFDFLWVEDDGTEYKKSEEISVG
ncbi:MAG: thiosulfate oxidation carrier complex protein SoxZ [Proteobacteria bacterium]|nr:thiosulfate oxidation carrier complex protein SoxZ [Pseudomonadota bacterium]MDA0846034.1 thiosulfate oxidation carrier complex protein SoxZ [Pseudomonadota bacterium]